MATTSLKRWAGVGIVATVAMLLVLGAAAPRVFTPWPAFKGTNGIVIVTNRTTETVRVDGAAMTNSLASTNFVVSTGTAVSNGTVSTLIANDITTSNGVLAAAQAGNFIQNFNGNGTNTTFRSSNTTSIAITAFGITGGTNIVEFNGSNSTTSIGPSGGVHIGGMSAVGGSNLVVEGRVGIGTNAPQSFLDVRATSFRTNIVTIYGTNGARLLQLGPVPGLPTYGGMWGGDVNPTGGNFVFYSDGVTVSGVNSPNILQLAVAGSSKWNINSSGHFLAQNDNTYDIGASGATRPRNYFGAGNVTFGTGGYMVDAGFTVQLLGAGGLRLGSPRDIQWANADNVTGLIDTKISRGGVGDVRVSTNLLAIGTITATNGFASYRSNLLVAATITVGASPSSWTNTSGVNAVVYVDGISVTGTVGINGGTVFNSIGQNTILLGPNEWTTITFTIGTPTATWRPR